MKVEYKGFIIYKDKNGKIRSYKPGTKSEQKNSKKVKDITSSFKKQKKDKKSVLEIEEGIDENEKITEIAGAKWLLRKRGGKIIVLKEKQERKDKGRKNPDYLYNDKLWDWKENTTSTFKAVKGLVKKGSKQIRDNPGGVVVDVSKIKLDNKTIKEAAEDGTRENGTKNFLTIVKKDDKIVAVYKKK